MKHQETTSQQYNFSIIKHGDISTPQGFTAGGMHIGLRANKKDFGWIYSSSLASAAAVYTLNQFKAAPLIVTEDTLQKSKGKLQALVVNSANANSCTGQQGIDDAQQTQTWVAQQLQIPSEHVAVASTGVIGEYLPMDKIKTGTEHINDANFTTPGAFNEAILTTDTCTKHIAVSLNNDMVLVMANQQVEHQILNQDHPQWEIFVDAFNFVCTFLAKAIARDGEGATKLISVNVSGAKSISDARKIGKTIVSSNLVKSAIFGEDANFGRIITAIGYSGCEIDPNCTYVQLNQIPVVDKGMAVLFDEQAMSNTLTHENVTIDVQLGLGNAAATAYGCDLSYDYVRINASYRT
ncbi:bifunctional ornithine acetyltransferase/N-acetylglutamate synthase [Staphylococcus aureus]|uniref:bifunctional ornithine acetyltransferase/N-acetylglutamate synthase n=1 Tax=Staphylococcus aureus TaxID=1280 RepID=UPI001FD4BC52|nr:bifunctional ornithine acetyltransferase/N-acetylglutamate synthase [Staphylococcus aureus]MCJ8093737.1 bifunctional ornithine acetyltransferase/N-acetylglutamate synthase [Staphylococcus aureus]